MGYDGKSCTSRAGNETRPLPSSPGQSLPSTPQFAYKQVGGRQLQPATNCPLAPPRRRPGYGCSMLVVKSTRFLYRCSLHPASLCWGTAQSLGIIINKGCPRRSVIRVRTNSQRWQDMTARLCEMRCEAESQHAQVDSTAGQEI